MREDQLNDFNVSELLKKLLENDSTEKNISNLGATGSWGNESQTTVPITNQEENIKEVTLPEAPLPEIDLAKQNIPEAPSISNPTPSTPINIPTIDLAKTQPNLPTITPEIQSLIKARKTASLPSTEPSEKVDIQQAINQQIPQQSLINELQNAIQQRNDQQIGLDIIKGFTQIGSKGRADTSALDKMREGAGKGIDDIFSRYKIEDLERSSKSEKDKSDPNSEISKAYRNFAKETGHIVSDKTSAAQLEKISPLYEKAFAFKEGLQLKSLQMKQLEDTRERNRELRQDTFLKSSVDKISENLVKNALVKKIQEKGMALSSVDQLTSLSKKGNTIAANALGANMARAMGEVGVLTEEDVKRYVQSGRLDRKAEDSILKMMKGKPSDATLNEITQIANVLKDKFDTQLQPIFDNYAARLSRNHDIPLEKAYYLIDAPIPSNLEIAGRFNKSTQLSKEETVDVETPDGKVQTIFKKNLESAKKRIPGLKVK